MKKELKGFSNCTVDLGTTCLKCKHRYGLIVDVDKEGRVLKKQHEFVILDYAEYEKEDE
jgi:hypothetical protein